MPSATYSFIDIVVLDDVRERFAAGDSLAILSTDLEEVIWANGPGAAVFGYPDIEAIIGASTRLGLVARRQIMATAGYPDIGRDKGLAVRLATGMTSQAVSFLASAITLPDGEQAILLAVPAGRTASHSEQQRAERTIGGLNEPGHFAALVDSGGTIVAAPPGFSELGIAAETLTGLVAEVKNDADRLVKRLIPARSGRLPAGFARLTDAPALHLLVVIDEIQDAVQDEAGVQATVSENTGSQIPASETIEPGSRNGTRDAAGNDDRRPGNTSAPATGGKPACQDERWYFNTDRTPPAEISQPPVTQDNGAAPAAIAQMPAFERETTPVRFAWRTDADGNFNAISPEFARAVGGPAADIVGRKFRDIATIFGFDSAGEISGLLDRRDTWSGRSVLWPVSGTDLRIPVDLAALPVYGRERNFEGFRGFGVARGGDAVPDPEALGLALMPTPAPETASAPGATEPAASIGNEAVTEPADRKQVDPFKGEVPALTIVPKQERRFSDKVIRLAEHRAPANDKGLTSVERNAFREIGDRLKKESAPAEEAPATVDAEDSTPAVTADATSQPVSVGPVAVAPLEAGKPAADEAAVETPAARAPADEIVTEAATDDAHTAHQVPTGERQQAEPDAEIPVAEGSEPAEPAAPELRTSGFMPSAFPAGGTTAGEHAAADTSILAKLPVPVLIHSGDDLHYANGEFLQLTGYASIEDLSESGGLDTLFGEPYAEDADAGERKMRLLTRGGDEFPVEAHLQSVPWHGGKALLLALSRSEPVIATPEPVEEAAAAQPRLVEEADLENRIAEMRAIVDTATDGVVLIANDGSIRSISRAAEALFGFDNDDVIGKQFVSLFAIESQRSARDYLAGLSENGVASVLNDGREVIGREAEGRFIPLFMTIGRLPNDSGFCAVVRDITQWKRAEEELTQARAQAERTSSQKTDFLARVSHEIRTPLNAIIGFSELMIDEKFGPIGNDRYRDYLRDINRSGNHVLDLVNDLLDISKIEAGEQEMAYEAVSLNDTLSETVAMMQPQANRERVIIRSSFASRLPEVVADLRSVRQIALNLLSNAVRYTQAGGQVIVSTAYEPSGDIVMRVRDTGIGMSQAEIEQALKPFKQINALKRGRGDGTGLGLPLTKAMVEANRAKFSIASTPGEGTLVEITFPSTRVLAD
ncbi:PAS domain S-box protein [Mesorhizobium sp. ZC-5]|uniref:PAS domain S-box protein n=1 Tax=Mesorhizobium sp. ZC-5 TaxID=2986066 RepID=UPI0021E8162C|nr:PAS domain S-box protein [Mesorhizobium sp. ZC-5]MCV3242194.1 PAS domain S-box protein [Mesorhizobium sp. ZC-5]